MTDEYPDFTHKNVDIGYSQTDVGHSRLFPRIIHAKYVRIVFEDCLVNDIVIGRLIFE